MGADRRICLDATLFGVYNDHRLVVHSNYLAMTDGNFGGRAHWNPAPSVTGRSRGRPKVARDRRSNAYNGRDYRETQKVCDKLASPRVRRLCLGHFIWLALLVHFYHDLPIDQLRAG